MLSPCTNRRTAQTNVHGAATKPRVSIPGRTHMTRLTQAVRSFARQDEGQDLLEYSLLVALIALVAVGAVTEAGVQVNAIFGQIADAI